MTLTAEQSFIVSKDEDELIIEFLTKGYSDADVFHIIPACSPEALDLIKRQHYEVIVRGMRDYYLVRKQSDDKMDYLESLALERLEASVALEADPMKLLKIFQTLNSAKRRSEGEGQANTSTTIHADKVVQLQMPARMLKQMAAPDFETNTKNEVIRVGNTDMATASNTQVLAQLNDRMRQRTITEDGKPISMEDI